MQPIEEVGIETIVPYENNPRVIDDVAIDDVADSIKRFGWRQPIVIDSNNVIVVGHTRHLAARRLGQNTVPVLRATDLSDEDARAYRLSDNKTSEQTGWNIDMLTSEMKGMQELCDAMNVPFEMPGFDANEIESLQAADTLRAAVRQASESVRPLTRDSKEAIDASIDPTEGGPRPAGNKPPKELDKYASIVLWVRREYVKQAARAAEAAVLPYANDDATAAAAAAEADGEPVA